MQEDIAFAVNDGIARITINRPSVSNAFRQQTIDELSGTLDQVRDSDGIYGCILTGANGSFCAGADVNSMPDWSTLSEDAYEAYLSKVQGIVRTLREMNKPSLAAVDGPAIGAGCDFALACDLRVVSPTAVLREGFVQIGLVPGDGGAWLLPRLIGESKAREYLLTGKDITAKAAVDLGLAVEIDETPAEAARELLQSILENPALAVRKTNELIDPEESFGAHCERATAFQLQCINDAEHEEAVSAFREKRKPSFNREYADDHSKE